MMPGKEIPLPIPNLVIKLRNSGKSHGDIAKTFQT